MGQRLACKLSERLSVKDFGALGDGVTDDTLAIRAAIAALSAPPSGPGQGEIFFPSGVYMVKPQVGATLPQWIFDLESNLTLRGVGGGYTDSGSVRTYHGSWIKVMDDAAEVYSDYSRIFGSDDLHDMWIDRLCFDQNTTGNPLAPSGVSAVTITAAGAGYHELDVLTITTGGTGSTVRVDSIGDGGAVTAITLLTPGIGYTTGAGKVTTVVPAGGTGCTLNITTVYTWHTRPRAVIFVVYGRNIKVTNCLFDELTGVWAVNVCPSSTPPTNTNLCENITVTYNHFRWVPTPTASPGYDNSAVYLDGKHQLMIGNHFKNTETAIWCLAGRACMEAHTGPARVIGNTSEDYDTLVNIVSDMPTLLTDISCNIVVANNTVRNARVAISLWPFYDVAGGRKTLRNVSIVHNEISINNAERYTADSWNAPAYGIGIPQNSGNINDIEGLQICHNTIRMQQEERGSVTYHSSGIDLVAQGSPATGYLTHALIANNIVIDAPVHGLRLIAAATDDVCHYRDIEILDNIFVNCGNDTTRTALHPAAIKAAGLLTQCRIARNQHRDTGVDTRVGKFSWWIEAAAGSTLTFASDNTAHWMCGTDAGAHVTTAANPSYDVRSHHGFTALLQVLDDGVYYVHVDPFLSETFWLETPHDRDFTILDPESMPEATVRVAGHRFTIIIVNVDVDDQVPGVSSTISWDTGYYGVDALPTIPGRSAFMISFMCDASGRWLEIGRSGPVALT